MHIYHAHIIPRRPPPEADFADSCDSLVRAFSDWGLVASEAELPTDLLTGHGLRRVSENSNGMSAGLAPDGSPHRVPLIGGES